MKQVTLKVSEKKFDFFMELIGSLGFVKKVEEEDLPVREKILQDIREAVNEVNLIKAGKLKAIPAKDLLREL